MLKTRFALTASALAFGCAMFHSGCASAKPKPRAASWPPDSLSLDYIAVQSQWIGRIQVRAEDLAEDGTLATVWLHEPWTEPTSIGQVTMPWPAAGSRGRVDDTGFFLIFLRKDSAGTVARPVFGRTLFRTTMARDYQGLKEYVPFRLGEGYPDFDSMRVWITPYEAPKDQPDVTGILAHEGIWLSEFRKYIEENNILWILDQDDSSRFDWLEEKVHYQSNNAQIMLHYLAHAGKLDWMGRFIERGNFVDFSDHALRTPLWICMAERNPACMDTLLSYGANPNLITPDDSIRWTPLHAASVTDWPELAAKLRAHGAGLYFRDEKGLMPLHKAACSDSGMLEVLAYANDSLDATTPDGKTALDLAQACGKPKNVAFLEEASRTTMAGTGSAPDRAAIRRKAFGDGAHKANSLLALSPVERQDAAARAMFDLVELECGFEGLHLWMEAREARTACRTLADGLKSDGGLGVVLRAELEKEYTAAETDTLLAGFIQTAYGKPMPVEGSKTLRPGRRRLYAMHREIAGLAKKTLLEAVAEGIAEDAAKGP